MGPNWNGIEERLSSIKATIGELDDHISAGDGLATCRAYCNQLLLDGSALNTNDSSLDDKRQIAVNMRSAIHKLQEKAEEMMTQSADAYRKAIGPDKEIFEQMPAELQAEQAPEAYRHFAAYHSAASLHDQLGRLNGDLLDFGGTLEQHERAAEQAVQPAAWASADIADATQYDRDPPPSSLSP